MSVREIQQRLAAAGFDPGPIDGISGARTLAALDEALTQATGALLRNDDTPMAWGARVSPAFRARVRTMAARLGASADDIMAAIAWESGRTFSPSVRNMAGSGATGLIQFMPATARALGTTTAALAAMTAERQLDYVERYFHPFAGKLRNLGDLYMAILWPAGVGKSDEFVLWKADERPTTYRQNAGLDIDGDRQITRGEALAKVQGLLEEGRKPGNLWRGG